MDRALFEKALKEMSQREGLTPEERIRRCVELCVQAQYMDSEQYLRMMHDSTKRPWVGLTQEEMYEVGEFKNTHGYVPTGFKRLYAAIEAKLKEKNNG